MSYPHSLLWSFLVAMVLLGCVEDNDLEGSGECTSKYNVLVCRYEDTNERCGDRQEGCVCMCQHPPTEPADPIPPLPESARPSPYRFALVENTSGNVLYLDAVVASPVGSDRRAATTVVSIETPADNEPAGSPEAALGFPDAFCDETATEGYLALPHTGAIVVALEEGIRNGESVRVSIVNGPACQGPVSAFRFGLSTSGEPGTFVTVASSTEGLTIDGLTY